MAKKRMPIYGIIDILRAILAYNLAKYQHFSMRPGYRDYVTDQTAISALGNCKKYLSAPMSDIGGQQ